MTKEKSQDIRDNEIKQLNKIIEALRDVVKERDSKIRYLDGVVDGLQKAVSASAGHKEGSLALHRSDSYGGRFF